jgi:hypothetical protein
MIWAIFFCIFCFLDVSARRNILLLRAPSLSRSRTLRSRTRTRSLADFRSAGSKAQRVGLGLGDGVRNQKKLIIAQSDRSLRLKGNLASVCQASSGSSQPLFRDTLDIKISRLSIITTCSNAVYIYRSMLLALAVADTSGLINL